MKFYLSSARDWEPYDNLKDNRLMQNYLKKIKEVGVEVTFEKDTKYEGNQHIVIDIPSMKALAQIMKAIDTDLVIEQEFIYEDEKYPILCIYDDYIE